MNGTRLATVLIAAAVSGAALGAPETPAAAAPDVRQMRSAEVRGILDGQTVRLKNGVYVGPPFVKGGASRPRVELLGAWTAAGDMDGKTGDERAVLLSEESGGSGVHVFLAVFGARDGKLENLGTALVGDRVKPKGMALERRTIVLDLVEAGPADPACCPTQASRRSYRLGPGGLVELPDVPFDLIHGQIVMRVAIGAVSGLHVLLDTGTNPSVIDFETSARLGLPAGIRSSGEASGTGDGRAETHASRIAGLRVGTAEIPPMDAVATDLSQASRRLGLEIAGILGYDFFLGRIVEIDYPRRRVRLHPDAPAYPETALVAPLRTQGAGRAPLLENLVKIDGKSIPVTLDTGSSFGLEVYPNARAVLGNGPWASLGRMGHVVGSQGEAGVRHVNVDSIAVGPFVLATRDLVLSRGEGEKGPRMGNLGNPCLDSFVLTLDDVNRRVVLARR